MMLRRSIYASGFNSTPSNYTNQLTHERIKSATSYGTSLTNSKADPLTPKPSIRYFITGDGAMKHVHHTLKTHPPENIGGGGRRRRRKHRRGSETAVKGHHSLYDNDFYDVDHPRAANGQPRRFNPNDPLDAPIAPHSYGAMKHSITRFRNGRQYAKKNPGKALGFRRKIFYSSRVV